MDRIDRLERLLIVCCSYVTVLVLASNGVVPEVKDKCLEQMNQVIKECIDARKE